jgi:ketosteroid isomerase-like protein
MRRISVFVTIAFLAGLGVGFFAGGGYRGMLQRKAHAADLAAIEKLHQIDIEVTLSQDPKGLIDVWAEDGVRLNPGSPPVVGRQAIQADNEKGLAENPGFKVLSYAPDLKNIHIQIADGWAYEWGETDAKFQLSPDSPPVSMHGKGIRVMRRQSDGSWKFALVCGNQ